MLPSRLHALLGASTRARGACHRISDYARPAAVLSLALIHPGDKGKGANISRLLLFSGLTTIEEVITVIKQDLAE